MTPDVTTEIAPPPLAHAQPIETRRWMRLLRPSLTDVFFLAMLFWLFASDPMGWDRLVWDGDTALHTRTGDFILDHGYIPTSDPFSFTKPGERWFAFQWLTGVVFAGLNRMAGLKGIVLLAGVVLVLYLTLLLRDMVQRGTNGLFAMLLVMVGANASNIHFHARPHIFTLLFLVIANSIIARDRDRPSWHIWLLVPLTILWTNMHSGFPALLAVLGLLVVGTALSGNWEKVRRYGAVAAACGLATLVNPNGFGLHLHIAKFLNSPWALDNINEYQSPVFRSEAMYYYMAILFLALMVCGRHFARRQWTECLWILFFAMGSLTSARHVPLFIITVLPLIGAALTELWVEFSAAQPRASISGVLAELAEKSTSKIQPASVWMVLGVAALALFGNSENWPKDLSEKYFPRAAVVNFEGQIITARVFTTDQWADYLLWKGYPKQRVFIDGRSDFFGEEIAARYVTAANGQPGWREVLNRYQINLVLLPPATPLVGLLSSDSGWRILHRDKQSVLLARAGAGAKE